LTNLTAPSGARFAHKKLETVVSNTDC